MTTDLLASRGCAIIASDGVPIVEESAGEGPLTVLLAHGGGQTRHAWRRLSAKLVEAGFRTVGYDMRGHGDSGWSPDADYGISALAGDLATVAARIDGPFVMAGASVGGLAGFYAAARGLPAEALILLDTALRPASQGTARVRDFLLSHLAGFASLPEAAAAVAHYQHRSAAEINLDGLARSLRLREGRWYWQWDPRFLPSAQALADRAALLSEAAPRVSMPVLLLRGERSDIVDAAALDEMRRLTPQLRVETVLGASHMVAGDGQDAYGALLIEEVRRIADTLSR